MVLLFFLTISKTVAVGLSSWGVVSAGCLTGSGSSGWVTGSGLPVGWSSGFDETGGVMVPAGSGPLASESGRTTVGFPVTGEVPPISPAMELRR